MSSRRLVANAAHKRLDVFLCEETELTRSAVKKLIEDGRVTVNGACVKAGKEIKAGDVAVIDMPVPKELSVRPENLPIEILYQDRDFAIVNKPQGMTVHMGNGNRDGTLVNALLYHLDALSGINGVIRPGIVHRIDKDTSGLLVVAKNDAAHVALSKQIAEKTCKRVYFALLDGRLGQDRGRVETDLGRNPKDRVKMAVVPDGKGKRAVTDYEVVRRYRGYTLVRFTLQTGRTHQIRVHAQFLGHPVVGDPVYGRRDAFGLHGQLLHAAELTLVHPTTGERMTFFAPLPEYFTKVLEGLPDE